MRSTTLLTPEEYYGDSNLAPFSLQEVIKQRVNKEAEVLSRTDYMPPVPKYKKSKVVWSEVAKRAFSNAIGMMTI